MRESRFFGSPAFRRLWFSQVLSSLGDWIGFVAITAIAARVGGGAGLGAVSLVLAARLVPGFFFSPVAGVLLDRWSRKHVMVASDIGRGVVLCALPFVDNLWGLVFASLLLELFTLMWSPAKEASVPNLVRPSFLPTANSLSLIAAYGTFPFASAVFAVLAKVPDWIGQSQHFSSLHLTKESVALYFDALTYVLSALVIATLVIGQKTASKSGEGSEERAGSFTQAKEGMSYIKTNIRVRTVIIGIATGLIGGGMIVPLGPAFANTVLDAGSGGYGLLLTAMGTGTAIGIVGIGILQKRLPVDRAFVLSVLGAGVSLLIASTMDGLGAAAVCIGMLGLCAGSAYVLGFTSLQVNVVDEMRGRVFATLYTATRMCLLIALTVAPLLSLAFDKLSNATVNGMIHIGAFKLAVPGVRVTLWLGAAIIILAGVLAVRALRPLPGTKAADATSADE